MRGYSKIQNPGDMKNEITIKPTVNFTVKCELTERELRALDALVGYGYDAFMETFYKMGKVYMEPYAGDLKELFEKIETLRPAVAKVDEARKLLGLPSIHV